MQPVGFSIALAFPLAYGLQPIPSLFTHHSSCPSPLAYSL